MTERNNTHFQMTEQSTRGRELGSFLLHRWPTVLGIVVALSTALDAQIDRKFVSFVAALIMVMPLIYLGAAVFERPSSAWLVMAGGLAVIFPLHILDMTVVAAFVLLAVAVIFLVLSLVRGQWRNNSSLLLQTIGMVVFGAVALVALYAQVDWAAYVLVAGLLSHAAWDVVHWWRNRVVTRSYAEFCAVIDFLLGVAILVML